MEEWILMTLHTIMSLSQSEASSPAATWMEVEDTVLSKINWHRKASATCVTCSHIDMDAKSDPEETLIQQKVPEPWMSVEQEE